VFFLARGLSAASRGGFTLQHEEAAMEMLWVPVDDLVEAVLAGRVTEEPISVAVLAYDALRRRNRP
jgi:ADP-ribose pyrophosphatase